MRLICANCHDEMTVASVGDLVEERKPDGSGYKLWFMDRHECGCGTVVHARIPGQDSYMEHFQPQYVLHAKKAQYHFGGKLASGDKTK